MNTKTEMHPIITTNTAIIRREIHDYLKSLGEGVEVRQIDLTNYIKENSSVEATEGTLRGIYNKMANIGGTYKGVKDIKISKKIDGSVYYYYEKDNVENTVTEHLRKVTMEFEELLKKNNLLNVSIIDLDFKQRKLYVDYIEQFEKLRNLFIR